MSAETKIDRRSLLVERQLRRRTIPEEERHKSIADVSDDESEYRIFKVGLGALKGKKRCVRARSSLNRSYVSRDLYSHRTVVCMYVARRFPIPLISVLATGPRRQALMFVAEGSIKEATACRS
jgi:hypothetical protein